MHNLKYWNSSPNTSAYFNLLQIRSSSVISDAPIILNLDCDMYSSNSDAVREALCFFMDERRGHQTAFVQFPQNFDNISPNDIYYNSCTVVNEVTLTYYGLHPNEHCHI